MNEWLAVTLQAKSSKEEILIERVELDPSSDFCMGTISEKAWQFDNSRENLIEKKESEA